MWTIKINNVRVRAYHGVYVQEQILGNDFIVNASVQFNADEIEQLNQTIDYARLYDIIVEEMNQPKKLLEEVIQCIIMQCKSHLPLAEFVSISIRKIHPAFGQGVESTEVVCEQWMNKI
jgi:7,8-dihydroneopterin aldolase/epimerase/oxygenase